MDPLLVTVSLVFLPVTTVVATFQGEMQQKKCALLAIPIPRVPKGIPSGELT